MKQQTLLGATGTGKSLAGDEPILIGTQDDYGRITWSVEPIGPFVDAQVEDSACALQPQPERHLAGVDQVVVVGVEHHGPFCSPVGLVIRHARSLTES